MAHDTPMQIYEGSYLTSSFDHATVLDAMHPGIITCSPETSMATVARTMATHHVHSVMVIGIEAEPSEHLTWGIVSDLDLVRGAAADGVQLTAGQMAASPAVTVDIQEPLTEVARVMG